jgi:integrase
MMKEPNQKPRREKFPITIKKGSATVKIYEVKNRDARNYTVSYVGATGRIKRTFAKLDEAKAEGASKARSLAIGDLEALKLSGREKQIYVEAERAIAATGLPLHSVAHQFAEAFKILGGANMVEAARYWKQHVAAELPPVTATEAVEKFREAKERAGLSLLYLKDIRLLLGDFAKDFQCQLSSIQPDDLQQYLNRKRIGPVALENRRRLLVALFNFAKAQGWLRPNEGTAADALSAYKIKRRDVEVYTPAEVTQLLQAAQATDQDADPHFVPYLALLAFGGVRREELFKRLKWEAINFERGSIIVSAEIAKTGRKRKIAMNENLIEWLKPFRFQRGPIFALDPRKRIAKIVKLSKVKWKRNGLRHSFGSYRMEQTKNEGLVALEMGNSPKVVKDHYFEIVDESAMLEYWSIRPQAQDDRKIVAIA